MIKVREEEEEETEKDNVIRIGGNAPDLCYADDIETIKKEWLSEKYNTVLDLVHVIRSFKPDCNTPQKLDQ